MVRQARMMILRLTRSTCLISDDDVKDYHSVHKAQGLIVGYLENQLQIKINKLREFTDGCAAQHKSRHCIGDLSC